jgi:tRNA (guanosine-2'-O-)-methyltransferase
VEDFKLIYDHAEEFTAYLSQFLSERKKALIDAILLSRTRHLTVVLEDIHKSHNASAVMRTSECFGVQDVHIIEVEHEYEMHPHIASGAAQWVTKHHYNDAEINNTRVCLTQLKEQGFKILVTSLDSNSKRFDKIDVQQKVAVVFGTEYTGVSDTALQMADETIHIPMFGITDSLNISVSSGIILQEYRRQLVQNLPDWQLLEVDKAALKLDWYMNSIRNVEKYVQGFLSKKGLV